MSEPADHAAAECVWPVAAELGEGPMWHGADGRLWFVDIIGGRIHWFEPATLGRGTALIDGMPGFLYPASRGGFVVGADDRLLRFDGAAVTAEIVRVGLPPGHRLNDAAVDPRGRLWFGSMNMNGTEPTGVVRVMDRGVIRVAGGAAAITNGPAVTADGRWLYHVDTSAGTIWRFDLDGRSDLAGGTPFVTIPPAEGAPDGVCVDADAHVWVGLWGGWAARRYAPDGRLVQTIDVPCANVTKVALGGADLRTAYITTARHGLDAAALIRQPDAGGLFACPVDTPGVETVAVAT